MNHVFCTECGNKIEYSYSKPKFCSCCGAKFGFASSVKKLDSEMSLADDETSIDEVPEIRGGLQVDLESYGNNVFSFESLIGEESSKPIRRRGSIDIEDFIDAKRR